MRVVSLVVHHHGHGRVKLRCHQFHTALLHRNGFEVWLSIDVERQPATVTYCHQRMIDSILNTNAKTADSTKTDLTSLPLREVTVWSTG